MVREVQAGRSLGWEHTGACAKGVAVILGITGGPGGHGEQGTWGHPGGLGSRALWRQEGPQLLWPGGSFGARAPEPCCSKFQEYFLSRGTKDHSSQAVEGKARRISAAIKAPKWKNVLFSLKAAWTETMAVLFQGASEKSGCLLALAGFLVGEGPVRGRGVGDRDTRQGSPCPAAPHASAAAPPAEAQNSLCVSLRAATRPEPNSFIPKTFFCSAGMMFSFFLSLPKEEETSTPFSGPSKG